MDAKQPASNPTSKALLRNVIVIVTLILVALLPFVTKEHEADVQSGIRIVKDLPYVEGSLNKEQRLDIMIPKTQSTKVYPLIVFIHGGGWKEGDKRDCPALDFCSRGFVVASINYRLAPQATFPAQIEDCKAAIRWLKENAAEYQLDPTRIGVWGCSAGGHLAALLGTTQGTGKFEGTAVNLKVASKPKFDCSVQAVSDWCGPSDLVTCVQQAESPRYKKSGSAEYIYLLLGGDLSTKMELAVEGSPTTYVSKDDPPFQIVHSLDDPIVPFAQSQELFEKLTEVDVPVKFVKIEGDNHLPMRQSTLDSVHEFYVIRMLSDHALPLGDPGPGMAASASMKTRA
jgi:acetyl esterase/lipase